MQRFRLYLGPQTSSVGYAFWGYRILNAFRVSHYVRARNYSNLTQEWTTKSALWPDELQYLYSDGEPTKFGDPLGLMKLCVNIEGDFGFLLVGVWGSAGACIDDQGQIGGHVDHGGGVGLGGGIGFGIGVGAGGVTTGESDSGTCTDGQMKALVVASNLMAAHVLPLRRE